MEWEYEPRRRIYTSYSALIIAACLISAILQLIIPGYMGFFTLSGYSFFGQHHYWTILTHMFLHGGFSHLFFNIFALFFIGPELERRIGGRNFLIVYLVSGMFAGFGYILLSSYWVGVIGASGAIYGILACLAILAPYMTIYIIPFPIPIKIIYLIPLFVIINLLMIQPGVAYMAHLSGLLVGILFGVVLKRGGPDRI